MPQKILSDPEWVDALADTFSTGRRQGVHVCVHTHFAHPNEISEISHRASDVLFQRGITIRNQAVLLRGVNDDLQTIICLIRKLAWINVQPYYIYIHDMVPGVETLRTSLHEAVELEKQMRGHTAGFMTPTFVCDTVGGGGKRDLHSYELYDHRRGIAIYRSPVIDPERPFFYFDPLQTLAPQIRQRWASPWMRREIIDSAIDRAGL
jgi:lysine 2,3-aminomutase